MQYLHREGEEDGGKGMGEGGEDGERERRGGKGEGGGKHITSTTMTFRDETIFAH